MLSGIELIALSFFNEGRETAMLFWYERAGGGYELQYGNDVGQVLLWQWDEKTVRINWIMVKKQEQRKGIGRRMLEEIKENIQQYFPGTTSILFQDVTSLGMLRLIESVFGCAERYVPLFLPEDMRLEWLKRAIDLPEKSPAKYNPDGSCCISKRAKRQNFIVHLTNGKE